MVQTWKSGDAGEFECPNCGSLYRRTVRTLPARDEDFAECEVCGGQVSRVLFAPAIHFKGTGFHNTDYGTRRRGAGEDGGGSGSGEGTSGNGVSSGDGKGADKQAAASAGSSSGGKTVGLDKV